MVYLLKEQVSSKELRSKLQQCLAAAISRNRAKTRRVLIAEDSATFRGAIVRLEIEMSCEVIEAADGDEVRTVFLEQSPDLVTTDM